MFILFIIKHAQQETKGKNNIMDDTRRIEVIVNTFYNKKNDPNYYIYRLREQIEMQFITHCTLDETDIYDSFIKKSLPIFLKDNLVEDIVIFFKKNLNCYNDSDSNQIIINQIKSNYGKYLVNRYFDKVKWEIKAHISEKMIHLFNDFDHVSIGQKSWEVLIKEICKLWGVKVKDFNKYIVLFQSLKFSQHLSG